MACRVPGADSSSKLWDILASSKDVQKEITRFNGDGFYAPDGGPRKGLTNVKQSYFIDGDVDCFDNNFFELSPLEANAMDPQQRLLLEVTYEAVENAGIPLDNFRGTDTAVFAATTSGDYAVNTLRDINATQKYTSTGTSNAIMANRLSYFFDLHGPSLLIDTACSSTMVALHYAVSSLKSGEAGMAVVCGVNLILNPDMFVHMSELGFLSPSGRCRSFDASGDGYARAEGVISLLLKPLHRARQDGDPIRAVIKGTRLNQNGKTQGITLPSTEEQKANLDALYHNCGIDPAEIQYLEAHGTGTAAGDPLELGAINAVFAPSHKIQKLVVGSVKSNIGHLESCAALAGIAKTVECLERGLIPPQMHFEKPNPKINFSNIEIPTSVLPWPTSKNGVRRAGINSFGFGGTNGHAVLEYVPGKADSLMPNMRPRLFKVSAANDSSLTLMAASYAKYIESGQPDLNDLAHTLLARRTTLKKSMFLVASSSEELVGKLKDQGIPRITRSRESKPKIGFVFTGQGAQWATMGSQLLKESPIFLSTVSECDQVLQALPDAPNWRAIEELAKAKDTSRVSISSLSQPLCTILQIGLVELWKSWGIKPCAVVGHSSGEVAAAYAAGILSLADAVIVAFYRGLYLGTPSPALSTKKGAMCAIGLNEINCRIILEKYPGRACLAAVNSPSSCTLSGDEDAISAIAESCEADGTFCRMLRVDMAYHSHHMLPLAPVYENAMTMAGVSPTSPPEGTSAAMFSSVYGGRINPKSCIPAYWKENMTSTVQFTAAIREMMLQEHVDVLVELGPHPALKGPVSDTIADLGQAELPYFASCFRGKPDMVALLESVGQMIATNMPIDAARINAKEEAHGSKHAYRTGRVLTDLPKYEWDHSSSFWAESRISRNIRFRHFPRHELLGSRIAEDTALCMGWSNILNKKEIPWLEQIIQETKDAYLTPSLFLLDAWEAARQINVVKRFNRPIIQLKEVTIENQLPLSWFRGEEASVELHFAFRSHDKAPGGEFELSALSPKSDDSWVRLCTGTMQFLEKATQPQGFQKRVVHDTKLQHYLKSFEVVDTSLIHDFGMDDSSARGRLQVSVNDKYQLDPAAFSTLLQVEKLMMLKSGLPGEYQLRTVSSVETEIGPSSWNDPRFLINAVEMGSVAGMLDLSFGDSDGNYIAFRGMGFEIEEQTQPKPLLESLFFKPQLLHDIASPLFSAGREGVPANMKISELMLLLTHKWPSGDVALVNMEPTTVDAIVSSTPGLQQKERPRLRSLTIVGSYQGPENPRIRVVEGLDSKSKFHMMFGTMEKLRHSVSMLLSSGLLCVQFDSAEERASFAEYFDLVCDIEGLTPKNWILGRLKFSRSSMASRKLKVFSNPSMNVSALSKSLHFDHAPLPSREVDSVMLRDSGSSNDKPRSIIVLDCGAGSILATKSANEWLSWLQWTVEDTETLLWVNQQEDTQPFANVAGSFIRTLRSEYPALKAASLVIKDRLHSDSFADVVSEVYTCLDDGNPEVELVFRDGTLQCLRYMPDDQLNASVGRVPPVSTQQSLIDNEYRIASAGSRRTGLLLGPPAIRHSLAVDSVVVETQASSIDFSDAVAFQDLSYVGRTGTGFGLFFAGIVVATNSPEFEQGTSVVGWSRGAHRSSIEVHDTRLLTIPEGLSAADAVTYFAACATAFAVIDGAARARPGDSFNLHNYGLVATAIEKVCQEFGATLSKASLASSDFLITFDGARGLTFNGRRVSVCHYLETTSRPPLLSPLFQSLLKDSNSRSLLSETTTFTLPELQSAFNEGAIRPLQSVVLHSGKEKVHNVTVDYTPAPQLFTDDGAYILLGGMGGLGRHLATWMVMNGAKNIVTISRSGLSSADAKQSAQTVEELGGRIVAFSVDVTNSQALDDVICKVRQQHKIRGCLNLAMVLQDAPFMKMTPEMWDRALRLKVDGSWNLHQSTLKDDLDFFILFSSIASITGNRSQTNYATGNAFQNALATYRRSIGLPGVSIALGSISEIGVLANDRTLLTYFMQMGHAYIGPEELEKVMEAAIYESHRHNGPPIICLGFEMFEALDGIIQKKPEQNQLFWTDFPEFSHLLDHKLSNSEAATESLKERLHTLGPDEAQNVLTEHFLQCLGSLLGYDVKDFDPESSIAVYGLDSLNAMSCRYWFFQNLAVDVPVFDVLGCKSIHALVSRVIQKLRDSQDGPKDSIIPQPISNHDLEYRPLSHSQRRLWFLHKYLPDKTVYNLLLVCHIQGIVNIPFFKKAWSVLLTRHEALRSRLVDTDKGLQQIPMALEEFPITDVTAKEEDHQSVVEEITAVARSHEFDIENGELVRAWLLQSPLGWSFFLTSHHLAWDRSSAPTIFAETTSIYKALVAGQPADSALVPLKLQFIDYTLWQEKCLETPQFINPLVSYWKNQLSGIPESVSLLPMALKDKRPVVKQLQTDQVSLVFDSGLGQAIKRFCAQRAVTPFMFMASSLSALVHRLTGDEDVVIGIADGDRGHPAFDELIGFTVNMLPIRSRTGPSRLFSAILEDYRKSCLEAYEHSAMPLDFLLSQLDIPRRTSHSPVFQMTVNYQMHGSFPQYDYGDFKFTTYDHYNARQQTDFSLNVEETATEELDCVFEFDTAIYDRQGIADMAEIYRTFIGNIIASDGELPLDQIDLMSASDRDYITDHLEQAPDRELIESCNRSLFPVLFEKAVSSHPDKTAVIDESRHLTWGEMDLLTKRIGNDLLRGGASPGEAIGVFAEPSADLVLAVWGIVRIGCAYVPIDPDFPDDRILSMMDDVDMQRVLVDGHKNRVQRMVSCGLRLANIYDISQTTASDRNDVCSTSTPNIKETDSFCCVFTSGSTGRPKGVFIRHGQLRYHQEGYNATLKTTSEDRILLASAMVFDLSLCAIYGTVLYGATMIVASREARYSPSKMVDLVIGEQISSCIFTPTQLTILLAASNRTKLQEWTCLRALALGGEAISSHLMRDMYDLKLRDAAFFNVYGPSETTVSASVARLTPEDAHRDVGLAPPHFPVVLYILDERGNRTPVGVPGELWIGGAGVSSGYVKRDSLTEQMFLPNSFSKSGLIYRTGDQFSLDRNGILHYQGRIGGDRQIKIRGMRIELGEIETALWDLYEDIIGKETPPLVHLAVVYHKKGNTDGVLTAYLAIGDLPMSISLERSLGSYFTFGLKTRLPIHMIPSSYVFLADLPTTVSGKTDYKTISSWPAPPRVALDSMRAGEKPELTKTQEGIATVWKNVLDIDGDIFADDNFFSLGGHSLLLMRVQAGIESKIGITLSLSAMFAEPTVRGMEKLLQSGRKYFDPSRYDCSDDDTTESSNESSNSSSQDQLSSISSGSQSRTVDWKQEAILDSQFDWIITDFPNRPLEAIAMTGASSMVGVHFLHQVLTTTQNTIYCLAEDAASRKEAHERVFSALKTHGLYETIPDGAEERIIAFPGSLTHEALGLASAEVAMIDAKAGEIYHMDSDVSLLKNYDGLRAGNVGALKFLVSLAHGNVGNFKAIHYLSTWGVPHLQAWLGTKMSQPEILRHEQEMSHMEPDADCGLAYLKARWVCEMLLYETARRGLPVTIYRSSMCGNSPSSGLGLKRTDINRRILEGSLQTGLVPDFGSADGGGMSWITSDFLAGSIAHLSLLHRETRPVGQARIFHIVADNHIPYDDLANILQVSYGGQRLRTASPEEWFSAMRATGNPEMAIQAEVLSEWWQAGWLPFALDASKSRRALSEVWDGKPPVVDRQFLLKSVIGEPNF
ncbi:uncharacterized protein K452DRAFT_243204 [Aplosporella prunicola CBS 121167]|uniref:Uncharacterized protein n=1 Tax=Aplosporella prunicola CBS 121167 TaxID=1176127 RepID=A0A6A6BNQ8_9PEZI|nr:uncharacterized protein K452DRAFT_243204 [Aplosporella prunicola CBS 121167]KAF2145308.1 hypothetical protein K452DRAFT_243204 [Aplosporella prunicola CBS 121167]